MADQDEAPTALLPPLPEWTGEGYEWMGNLAHGWHAVGLWGDQGWDLGRWPYVIIVHFDGDGLYGRAVYVEGDLHTGAYTVRAARDQATSDTAVFYWRTYENGPDLPPVDGPEPAPLFPPYSG